MEFQEFWREKARMCKDVVCEDCPFNAKAKRVVVSSECTFYVSKHPTEAEQVVEQWAKEHPIVTNGQKLMEIIAKTFDKDSYKNGLRTMSLSENEGEIFYRSDWWNTEYHPPKGEE